MILILLLSISVWVKLISQILKPNCREKEFLEFFPDPDIPVPQLGYSGSSPENWLSQVQKHYWLQSENQLGNFKDPDIPVHQPGYSGSTSRKLAKSRFRSGTDSNRKFSSEISRTRIFRANLRKTAKSSSELVLISTGNSARIFSKARIFRGTGISGVT